MGAVLSFFRPAISCLAAAALALGQLTPARAAAGMSRAEYEACQARDESGFRAAIEAIVVSDVFRMRRAATAQEVAP